MVPTYLVGISSLSIAYQIAQVTMGMICQPAVRAVRAVHAVQPRPQGVPYSGGSARCIYQGSVSSIYLFTACIDLRTPSINQSIKQPPFSPPARRASLAS